MKTQKHIFSKQNGLAYCWFIASASQPSADPLKLENEMFGCTEATPKCIRQVLLSLKNASTHSLSFYLQLSHSDTQWLPVCQSISLSLFLLSAVWDARKLEWAGKSNNNFLTFLKTLSLLDTLTPSLIARFLSLSLLRSLSLSYSLSLSLSLSRRNCGPGLFDRRGHFLRSLTHCL